MHAHEMHGDDMQCQLVRIIVSNRDVNLHIAQQRWACTTQEGAGTAEKCDAACVVGTSTTRAQTSAELSRRPISQASCRLMKCSTHCCGWNEAACTCVVPRVVTGLLLNKAPECPDRSRSGAAVLWAGGGGDDQQRKRELCEQCGHRVVLGLR